MVAMPSAFDFVGCDSVMPLAAKMSEILPMPMTGTPASVRAFRTVRGGSIEKIVAIRRAREAPRLAYEGPCDHAAMRHASQCRRAMRQIS